MEYINYKFGGKNYYCRVIEDKDGNRLIIGGLDFLDALQPGSFSDENEGFASKEAEAIYDEIFYFTDVADLQLDDEQMIALLKADNPDWFD